MIGSEAVYQLLLLQAIQQMKSIPITFHLTVHKLAFHLKFPATLALELEIDKSLRMIANEIPLGKEAIMVNKEIRHEAYLSYQESTKQFEDKKISIIISIKTKTSQNRLTAGVVPITLCRPSEHVSSQRAKPLRCNDPKAYIEYSLRTETAYKLHLKNQSRTQAEASEHENNKQTSKNIFKSAVHYINNQQEDVQSHNELQRYLGGPISRAEHQDRRRYKSSHKIQADSTQNCEDQESKTEIMSIRKEKKMLVKDCSIASSQESHYERKVTELSKKSEALSKQVNESRLANQNLKAQIKELKAKVKKYESQLDEQSSLILSLNRKLQLKDSFSFDEAKQLKNKLQQTETQLHQVMMEKNLLLNQWESKERELMMSFKEKERSFIQDKKKMVVEIQRKNQQLQSLREVLEEVREAEGNAQEVICNLAQGHKDLEEKYAEMGESMRQLKIEVSEKTKLLNSLQGQLQEKEKVLEEQKGQKKMVFELKQEKDEKDRSLKQNILFLQQMTQKMKEKDDILASKANQNHFLSLQCESLRKQLKEQNEVQAQLSNKVKAYEGELRRTSQNSNKITTQIREVQSELSSIKKQANTNIGEKSKLIGEYQRFISILKEKIQAIAEEKGEAEQKQEEMGLLLRQKQDELSELAQQLISIKDEHSNLSAENQMLREENGYLNKCIKQLSEKQEKLLRLQQKLQYNQRLYEQLEQRCQLQRIQLENEIHLLEERNEEKGVALSEASEQLRRAEREEVEYRDQLETLRISLGNKTSELNYLKIESERYRENNIQFEERMAALRRIEDTATTSIEDLQEENLTFKQMIKENDEAITTLGKRYDRLYKSTMEALSQLMEALKSQKIGNCFIRHERAEISSMMNDFVREVALERESSAQEVSSTRKLLQTEAALNRENLKVIKIKSQIQSEQEEEMRSVKALSLNLEHQIAQLQNDLYLSRKDIKEKEGRIADLLLECQAIHKQHATQLRKKDEEVAQHQEAIAKLHRQLAAEEEKHNASSEKWRAEMVGLESDLKGKLSALNEALGVCRSDLKSERDASRQLRSKVGECEAGSAKLARQREELVQEVDKRTKQLISARIECESRSKKIAEREEQVAECNKRHDRLAAESARQAQKLQKLQGDTRQLCARRSELQATLKERCGEVLALRARAEEGEEARSRLLLQREELAKAKAAQESLASTLSQSVKALRDSLAKSEDTIKKMAYDKQCAEKEMAKRLNLAASEKASLERQLGDCRARAAGREAEQSGREKALVEQLRAAKASISEQAACLEQLLAQAEELRRRTGDLSSELGARSAEVEARQRSLLASSGQIRELLQWVGELRSMGKEYESSKNKLLRLSSQGGRGEWVAGEVARELSIGVNRLKIQVLGRLSLGKEAKAALLEGLQQLQGVAAKLEQA